MVVTVVAGRIVAAVPARVVAAVALGPDDGAVLGLDAGAGGVVAVADALADRTVLELDVHLHPLAAPAEVDLDLAARRVLDFDGPPGGRRRGDEIEAAGRLGDLQRAGRAGLHDPARRGRHAGGRAAERGPGRVVDDAATGEPPLPATCDDSTLADAVRVCIVSPPQSTSSPEADDKSCTARKVNTRPHVTNCSVPQSPAP